MTKENNVCILLKSDEERVNILEITERSGLVENSIEEILNQAWSRVLSEISLGYTGNAHYSVRVSKEISVLAKVYIERYR